MLSLLINKPDGQEIEQGFNGEQTMVGRHEKCDLRLVDSMVSRNHCIILKEGRRFVVKDLESRNGTWINGRRIKNRRSLRTGDVIQVGPFRLFFQPESRPAEQLSVQTENAEINYSEVEPSVHRHEAEIVVKPLGMISNYLSEATVERIPTKIRRERLNRNLVTLYRITEELVTTKDMAEILDYIMLQIFDIFSPSQATILLRDRDETPVPIKQKSTDDKGTIRPISNTIVNRILKDRVAILTENALEDPRFEMGESVIIDGIRSVMAAPIWEDRTILGVIYVDSLDIVGGYQSEDLDLLTAIGHQTALAIQRWKLTERLREEAVKSAVIRQNLSRFHSAQIVDLILEGAADLAVKETVATIFFCDIVGFTSLCESCRPQQLQEILNLFCKIVNQIVFNEQGTLDKFIGDAALAIFGAPLPQEDAPVRAVRSALKIRERLEHAVLALPKELRFRVRYGINTGPAIVGNFGSDERMDYTILGHAVNLASRISQAAEPDQILIGMETYEQIADADAFSVQKVASRPLKGVKGKLKLYEVQGFL
ncbi:MAG: FHA domain-containing protein [Desulfomonile tiedjei]|uniref:FHA domain-containing protein n=1 Tax=Desulfomonile tiedjei TaxID=2358 RepID=A0A9D6V0D8_9BACT|nr:FHA domain-containing protein [Desulfomonile tiedjei]